MTRIIPLLAEADLVETLAGSVHTAHSGFRDMAIVLGSLFGISLLITFWLVFIRKKPRVRKHHHHHRPAVNTVATQADGDSPPVEVKQRRKWKRQRQPHRPRNPTLAETGGLPPARDGQTPPPSLP